MPHHEEQRHFDYTTTQLYALVSDVERYPEFLPWVRAARIIERHEEYFLAELVVCFKHITEKYTSKVWIRPPQSEQESGQIDVELVDGPFNYLENHWRFTPNEAGGCEVSFKVDFQFRTKWLDRLIGVLFTKATQKMVGAFMQEAEKRYG